MRLIKNSFSIQDSHSRGFTIVELLIVIVVIGIVATITVVAYNGIQQRAVEAGRQTDVVATAKALEYFYVNNNRYPNYGSEFNLRAWAMTNLGLPESALIAPGDTPDATVTSFANLTMAQLNQGLGDQKQYAYYNYGGTRAVKTACASNNCQLYELYWYSNTKSAWQTVYSSNE